MSVAIVTKFTKILGVFKSHPSEYFNVVKSCEHNFLEVGQQASGLTGQSELDRVFSHIQRPSRSVSLVAHSADDSVTRAGGWLHQDGSQHGAD